MNVIFVPYVKDDVLAPASLEPVSVWLDFDQIVVYSVNGDSSFSMIKDILLI